MTAVVMRTRSGPRTFVPAELILGSQVVEARSDSRVGVAGPGSVHTLGIAITDGVNSEALYADPVLDSEGRLNLNAGPLRPLVSVAYSGMEVSGVRYAAAAEFGDALKAAAAGSVTPMADGEDSRLRVGTCAEPAGVMATRTGLVRAA